MDILEHLGMRVRDIEGHGVITGRAIEPLTLLRFYSDEPGQQSGEMDTLQIHLFGN